MEGVAVTNVTYLSDISFDKFESIFLNGTAPLAQLIFDIKRCRPDPLQLEMKDSAGIVNDIVMEKNRFCLVAPLDVKLVFKHKIN